MKGGRFIRSGLAGGLVDQAVVSLGSFGLNVVLARHFPASEYGVFSIVLSFILFFNTLHQALISYPLSVRGAPAEPSRYEYFLCVAVILTPLCALIYFSAFGVAMYSVKQLSLLLVGCCALFTWQMQEVARRGLLARARYSAAIGSDAIRSFGTLGGIFVLGPFLTVENVFLLMVVSSIFATWTLLPAISRNFSSAMKNIREEIGIHWHMAAPILGANLLAAFSTQWFLWLLAWHQGFANSAVLVALANVVAISSPVMFGVENILVPEIARLRASLTYPRLMHLVGRRGLVCGALIAPFLLLIAVFPQAVLRLFYGHATPYAPYMDSLRVLAAAYACYLASYILGATLRGYQAREAVFRMQLYPALMSVVLGSWLTWQFGVLGACVASLLAGFLRAGTGLYDVLRLRELTVPVAHAIAGPAMP